MTFASMLRALACAALVSTAVPAAAQETIRTALATSLHETFLMGALIVAAGLLVVVFLREIPLRKSFGDAPGAVEAFDRAWVALSEAPDLNPEPSLDMRLSVLLTLPMVVALAGDHERAKALMQELRAMVEPTTTLGWDPLP